MDLFIGEERILDIQSAVFPDERIQKLSMPGYVLHVIIIMLGKRELDDDLSVFVRISEMLAHSFDALFIGLDDLISFLRIRNELPVIDIIIEKTYFEDLLEHVQESALACSVGSDEDIHIGSFLIIKFSAFDHGKIGFIRKAQKV